MSSRRSLAFASAMMLVSNRITKALVEMPHTTTLLVTSRQKIILDSTRGVAQASGRGQLDTVVKFVQEAELLHTNNESVALMV
jgi:hypothetical protein